MRLTAKDHYHRGNHRKCACCGRTSEEPYAHRAGSDWIRAANGNNNYVLCERQGCRFEVQMVAGPGSVLKHGEPVPVPAHHEAGRHAPDAHDPTEQLTLWNGGN